MSACVVGRADPAAVASRPGYVRSSGQEDGNGGFERGVRRDRRGEAAQRGGRGRRGTGRGDPLSRRVRRRAGEHAAARGEAGREVRPAALLLRGRSDGVRAVPTDRLPGPSLHGRRTLAHPAQAERPGEDEPARRDHTGPAAAGGRANGGVGEKGREACKVIENILGVDAAYLKKITLST